MVTRIELFERIRRDRRVDPNVSQRELMSRHAVSRRTVLQALNAALPPQRKRPIRGRPSQLAPVAEFIDAMLREDLNSPRKQKHTIMRICQRLADEYDFHEACYSTVRNYVTPRRKVLRAEAREGHAFLHGMVPQVHLPGEEAEVDFCEVTVDLAGRGPVKCFMFTLRLSFSGRAVHRPIDRTNRVSYALAAG